VDGEPPGLVTATLGLVLRPADRGRPRGVSAPEVRDFGRDFGRDFVRDFGIDPEAPDWVERFVTALEDEENQGRLLADLRFWNIVFLMSDVEVEKDSVRHLSAELESPLPTPVFLASGV
jgi:hypothetical protein